MGQELKHRAFDHTFSISSWALGEFLQEETMWNAKQGWEIEKSLVTQKDVK
jgi:hypothetical protein